MEKGLIIMSHRDYQCVACGDTNVVVKKSLGDVVCTNCGCVIVDHIIDYQPEWKGFSRDDTKVGSADAFARCTRMRNTQVLHEVQATFMKGGSEAQRKEFSRIQRSLAFTRAEIKYIKYSAHLQRLCHQINVAPKVEVRSWTKNRPDFSRLKMVSLSSLARTSCFKPGYFISRRLRQINLW